MVKKKRRVIEITKFRLNKTTEEKEFVKKATKIQKFLEKQEGFEHRMLLHNMKNEWTEIIQWRNVDYAKDAKKNLKKIDESQEYFESISIKTSKTDYPELAKMF